MCPVLPFSYYTFTVIPLSVVHATFFLANFTLLFPMRVACFAQGSYKPLNSLNTLDFCTASWALKLLKFLQKFWAVWFVSKKQGYMAMATSEGTMEAEEGTGKTPKGELAGPRTPCSSSPTFLFFFFLFLLTMSAFTVHSWKRQFCLNHAFLLLFLSKKLGSAWFYSVKFTT